MDSAASPLDPNQILAKNGIRPTKIRKAIARLLFDGHDKHVTVENVIDMARNSEIKTSVASVYNTLNQFAAAGLLRRVVVEQGRTFFDTNLSDHHHFYFEDEQRLEDIPDGTIKLQSIPKLPYGRRIKSIGVTIRV
ncbi:MAG: transcriptional repressor [Robiginitomaculum sp.]|nr:MAG: transcriptional repressor [Robiginitomaculum sp.]